jgi:hypothetical protein
MSNRETASGPWWDPSDPEAAWGGGGRFCLGSLWLWRAGVALMPVGLQAVGWVTGDQAVAEIREKTPGE